MNPTLPDLSGALPQFSIDGTPWLAIFLPHGFIYLFYLIALVIIFISIFLFWHWKEYGQDWIQGIAIYALYGFGTASLLLSIYNQIRVLT
jgi:hypothetical protein